MVYLCCLHSGKSTEFGDYCLQYPHLWHHYQSRSVGDSLGPTTAHTAAQSVELLKSKPNERELELCSHNLQESQDIDNSNHLAVEGEGIESDDTNFPR